MNKERGPLVPVWKKILKNKHQKISLSDVPVNVTQLPLFGTFDHTYRPGTLLWKTPKPKYVSGNNPKHVEIGPVYRLPVDSDDTGSQVKMEWAYANLKVRPRKLTINAVGPNKATWSIAVIEGTETSATWNLRETPSYSPLIEGFYTIQVHDQRGPNEAAKPGWLYTNSQLQVALYKTEGDHIGEVIKRKRPSMTFQPQNVLHATIM
ncbi:hypothetical protein BDB01DRAFT_805618 [Pilobolus umbonatus]|nr:hypothetical protein BDB01DRAFT_805618 [Pilobolus umbonatus]